MSCGDEAGKDGEVERGRLVCQGRGRGRMCLERGGGGKCGILEGRNKGLMGQRAMEMQEKTKRLF